MRLVEGATVHLADGTTYTIGADGKNGTSWTNYRIPKGSSSVEWFTYYGNEFLFYCEGATGKPYQCIEYPQKRLEAGETSLSTAWGDGYGHRSNKHESRQQCHPQRHHPRDIRHDMDSRRR